MNAAPGNRPSIVLYVEDDVEQRELLRSAAKTCKAKFGLALAAGLADAIEYLGGQDKYADLKRYPAATLVLLDYTLGTFKGTDLVRWIRKQREIAKLPVIMFSNSEEVKQMSECYAAGADYYIKKPTRFEDLLKIARGLDACLEHKPPRVAALADMAADPTLDRQALTMALREGITESSALREQARERIAKLDLTMAVRKEVLKQIPFQPRKKPPAGPDRK
jgi:DNA-binding response OmpR family regulator